MLKQVLLHHIAQRTSKLSTRAKRYPRLCDATQTWGLKRPSHSKTYKELAPAHASALSASMHLAQLVLDLEQGAGEQGASMHLAQRVLDLEQGAAEQGAGELAVGSSWPMCNT